MVVEALDEGLLSNVPQLYSPVVRPGCNQSSVRGELAGPDPVGMSIN